MIRIAVVMIVLFSILLSAQVDTVWTRRYNGPGNYEDIPHAMAIDDSGNIFVTGYSHGSGTYMDYATIKYDPAGNVVWIARYNDSLDMADVAYALVLDDSGNIYVTGTSYGTSVTWMDFFTIKYNALGETLWTRRYNGTGNDYDAAGCLVLDDSGNVYVAGMSRGRSTYDDILIIKYNSSGTQRWIARYDGLGRGSDGPSGLVVDDSGYVYVTGSSDVDTSMWTNYDYTIIKYNPSGTQQWVRSYNGPANQNDQSTGIVTDGNRNVYVTGSSDFDPRPDSVNYDYITIKYTAAGIQQWVARYNGTGRYIDQANRILIDDSANIYVTGASFGPGTYEDFATIKYDSSGAQKWVARYNNSTANYIDRPHGMTLDKLGNVYVTGATHGGHDDDYVTVKYNPFGIEQWVVFYDGPAHWYDDAFDIQVDNLGYVYVTGSSVGADDDYFTIKYCQTTGIKETTEQMPRKRCEIRVSPNPFRNATCIEFKMSNAKYQMKLAIFDVSGRLVRQFDYKSIRQSDYIVWDGADDAGKQLPPGVYFVRLKSNSSSCTSKIVLLQ